MSEILKAFILKFLGYKSQEDIVENLYLKSFLDAYDRIKELDFKFLEEKIRDLFIKDFETENEYTQELLKERTIILTWERWYYLEKEEKSRADISFSFSGSDFVLECKKLSFADKKYLEEGIQRFIELKYAEKDNFAGMIGFIVSGNAERIVQNLKRKVKNFYPAPEMEEVIKLKVLEHALSFQSKHLRINDHSVHLYHLFFDFTHLKS
ncbi:MAG: hypothetical protein NW226_05285 [Microscillaceae bacterium]|nr:hypothetical protein [Microscillaceae bacterium]